MIIEGNISCLLPKEPHGAERLCPFGTKGDANHEHFEIVSVFNAHYVG